MEIYIDTSDWKKEFRNLKQKASLMDKEAFKFFHFTKTTPLKNEIQLLLDQEEKYDFDRKLEKDELSSFINLVRKDVKNLKEALKSYSKTPEYLNRLQHMTERVENKLSQFKQSQINKFDALIEEEAQLYHEIMLINEKTETYDNPAEAEEAPKKLPPAARGYKGLTKYSRDGYEDDQEDEEIYGAKVEGGIDRKMKKLKEELDGIEIELEKLGGKNQGWPAEDQQTFLKIKTKHKNNIEKPAFENDCVTCLPFYGEFKLREHIEKHKQYCILDERKKELMAQYKECKDNQKQMIIDALHQEEEKKKEEEKKAKNKALKSKQEQDKVKEQLKQWKTQKVAREMVDKENKIRQEQERQRERERQLEAEKEEKLKKLEEYRIQKELEKIRKREKEEYDKSIQKHAMTREDFARIREKDADFLKKKQELMAIAKEKHTDKQTRVQHLIQQKPNEYAWVETRVEEKTKAAGDKERKKYDPKVDRPKTADTFGGFVVRAQGRAIPSWRQGV